MAKKKRHCASCGSDDRCHKDMETGLWLCIECETNEWYGGFPVLRNKPEHCPLCGGDILTGICSEEDFDETLAEYFDDEFDLQGCYCYEAASECDNPDCPLAYERISYGRRWYWTESENNFNSDKPLFGMEALRAELQAQETAGQKRLPGIDE